MNKKDYFLGLLAILFSLSSAYGQQSRFRVVEDGWEQLKVVFCTQGLSVEETQVDGVVFSTLSPEGMVPSNEVGRPSLPLFSQLIEVPQCDGFDVEVTATRYDTLDVPLFDGVCAPRLAPVQPSRSKSDTTRPALVMDGKTYAANTFYGLPVALVESVGVARDRGLARLQFAPVSYNPVSGQVVVCREATVTVRYRNADAEVSRQRFERYHTPAFQGATTLNGLYSSIQSSVPVQVPVRYLIVAHSMFRGQLDGFVQWKRRKGFLVDIAYTDSAAVGATNTSVQSFIQSQFTNATPETPAPTYLLLVGDHEQIPAFNTTISGKDHITDLYYATWTPGDNIPDCHYGRFSAQNIGQLTPQIQKTLMYEQYTFADPSFLDRAVMVAGVDGGSSGDFGYTHADPAMDYAITHYINGAHGFSQVRYFKNNTSIVPTGSNVTVAGNSYAMSSTVRSYYNQGAGWINYSAHGSATSWGTPNFTTTHAASMTNTQKFGVMVGNCCLTNKFETATCLGESVLRKGDYCGAVGYIGGSNSTYWDEDFYWAVGVRNNIDATMPLSYNATNLGIYDRLFHTHGESHNKWVLTQGDMMFQGNMAVQGSASSRKLYYWEIYHLMGDPSLMPYMTQADMMDVSVSPIIVAGTAALPVVAAPYAYIALVDTLSDQLIASAFADGNGIATLELPGSLMVGTYRLAASAQQYRIAFADISLVQPEGPFPIVSSVASSPLNAGDTVALTLHFENIGTATAYHVVAHLSTNNPHLALSVDTVVLDSLAAGATADLSGAVSAYVAADAPDNTTARLNVATAWTGCTFASNSQVVMHLYAPVLTIAFSQPEMSLMAGSSATLTATLRNDGHVSVQGALTLISPTSLLSATPSSTAPFALSPNSETSVALTLQADSLIPQHITIPLHCHYTSLDKELPVYIGQGYSETFEGGGMNLAGVANGPHPWIVIDTLAYQGTHSMRSAAGLTNYDSSVVHITIDVIDADSMSFYYRVSSEQNYDKFHFLIDGVEQFNASGEVDWTRACYYLNTGTHTLTFRYRKDVSWDRGSDCAWIDNIVLPHLTQAVVFRSDTLCAGGDYAPFGTPIDTREPGSGTAQGMIDGQQTLVDYLVLAVSSVTDSVVACDAYLWNGQEYTVDGTYTHIHANDNGCFDTVTVVLTLHHSVAVTVIDSAEGTNYVWNDNVYTASGEYQQVLTTADGCDSIVTLVLTLTDTIVGIADCHGPLSSLAVFPVPTTGTLYLAEPVDEVRIYDAVGRQVACFRNTRQLDLARLPQGSYLLRVTVGENAVSRRIVKQ